MGSPPRCFGCGATRRIRDWSRQMAFLRSVPAPMNKNSRSLLWIDAHLEYRSSTMKHLLYALPRLRAEGLEIKNSSDTSSSKSDGLRRPVHALGFRHCSLGHRRRFAEFHFRRHPCVGGTADLRPYAAQRIRTDMGMCSGLLLEPGGCHTRVTFNLGKPQKMYRKLHRVHARKPELIPAWCNARGTSG